MGAARLDRRLRRPRRTTIWRCRDQMAPEAALEVQKTEDFPCSIPAWTGCATTARSSWASRRPWPTATRASAPTTCCRRMGAALVPVASGSASSSRPAPTSGCTEEGTRQDRADDRRDRVGRARGGPRPDRDHAPGAPRAAGGRLTCPPIRRPCGSPRLRRSCAGCRSSTPSATACAAARSPAPWGIFRPRQRARPRPGDRPGRGGAAAAASPSTSRRWSTPRSASPRPRGGRSCTRARRRSARARPTCSPAPRRRPSTACPSCCSPPTRSRAAAPASCSSSCRTRLRGRRHRQRRVPPAEPLLRPCRPPRAAARPRCRRAMRVLLDPAETGAVTVALHQDVLGRGVRLAGGVLPPSVRGRSRAAHRRQRGARARASQLLSQAQRPLLIAGGGVRYSGAEAALRRLR